MMRLTTSLALPPANGMIIVIGRVGYVCALTALTSAAENSPPRIIRAAIVFIFDSPAVEKSDPLERG